MRKRNEHRVSAGDKITYHAGNDITTCDNIGDERCNLTNGNVLTCFPNPARSHMTFYFYIKTVQIESLTIINSSGTKLVTLPLSNDLANNHWYKIDLDISKFKSGNYFYIINYKEGYETGKFIKTE